LFYQLYFEFSSSTDIRIQQRSGRKSLTTVQGLPALLDYKLVLSAVKKVKTKEELQRNNVHNLFFLLF
jgi:hypothetical protein